MVRVRPGTSGGRAGGQGGRDHLVAPAPRARDEAVRDRGRGVTAAVGLSLFGVHRGYGARGSYDGRPNPQERYQPVMTREELTEAFPDDDITTATPESLRDSVADSGTRRFLVEVGFPEQVVGCLFFEELDQPLRTLREHRGSEHTPAGVAEHLVVGATDFHTICVDGASGACSFVTDESAAPQLAASGVETFVHFAAQLNRGLSSFGSVVTSAELRVLEERLITDFRQRDPAALTESEASWRTTIRRCVAEILS